LIVSIYINHALDKAG